MFQVVYFFSASISIFINNYLSASASSQRTRKKYIYYSIYFFCFVWQGSKEWKGGHACNLLALCSGKIKRRVGHEPNFHKSCILDNSYSTAENA